MRYPFFSCTNPVFVTGVLGLAMACSGMAVAGHAPAKAKAAGACRPSGLQVDAHTEAKSRAQSTLAHKVEATDACRAVPGVKVQSLGDLWASLVGDSRIGGKRFETPVPPGTPTGTVMLQRKGIAFDFRSVQGQGLKAFQLVDLTRRQQLVMARPPKADFHIAHLNRNDRYAWTLLTGAHTYQAKFDLLGPADQAEVEARLRKVDQAVKDPQARAFYKAAIYDDEGLYAQRDALLARLRTQWSR